MKAAGGVAEYNLTDPATGEVSAVTWIAPALNTIFYRYSEEEVRYILVYGRPFSPMPPWGVDGGGPMNDQQIDTLLAYLHEHPDRARGLRRRRGRPATCAVRSPARPTTRRRSTTPPTQAVEDGDAATYGEALYNLDLASGAYSCARCHTPGGATATPACRARARSAGTSPVARPNATSPTRPT